MSKWIKVEGKDSLPMKIGCLSYRRNTGEPYVNWVMELGSGRRKGTDSFSLATVQTNQQSLYLAFYYERANGESGMLTSRTISLPKGLPAGSEVRIDWNVKLCGLNIRLEVNVDIPRAGAVDNYIAGPETKGYLLLSGTNRDIPAEYDADAENINVRPDEKSIKKRVEAVWSNQVRNIVGMQDIKQDLQSLLQTMLLGEELEKRGQYMEKCNWHFLIGGASGSGKSTLAEAIHRMLYELKLVVEKNAQVVNAVQLLAKPELLTELVKKGMPRTIIVENFEKLCPIAAEEGQPVQEHDEFWILLFQCMEKAKKEDLCHFIFAGETEAVKKLLEKRQKLLAYVTGFLIPDYSEGELYTLGAKLMRNTGFVPADREAKEQFHKRIREMMVQSDFANAYSLKYIIGEAQKTKSARSDEKNMSMTLAKEDFMREDEKEETLEELLEELDSLTGLENVKKQIHQRLNVLKMEKLRIDRGLIDKKSTDSLHMVFHGNAGTGKTTIARIVGKIYGKAGLIKNGENFVEVSRESLVAGYQGQSAIKAMECVERAIGGVLFIDEAYNLVNGENDSFGLEVLNTLLAPIENNRENLTVIMAGYKEEMEELFRHNQGLASRMHTIIEFEDYSMDELATIFYRMAAAEKYQVREEDREAIVEYLWDKRAENAMEFANARGVRNCFEDAKLNQATRLIREEKERELSDEELMQLTLEDITGGLK
ncbi:MAG: AAA family ATPase [Lachnospiraceae bacterium]|nr:AAA family ATPase [Lachnospiraceae bacterium]